MKNTLIVGAIIGAVATTAIYGSFSNTSMKKAKKVFINKLEDIIM